MTMGDLSPNFSKSEFACKCGCGFGAKDGDVSAGLVVLLEKIRQDVGGPVRLTSGCRCEKHNRDIQVEGGRYRFMVAQSAFSHDAEGVGIAKGFVHVDVHDGSSKPRPSSWSY
jgi:hypothetical protein